MWLQLSNFILLTYNKIYILQLSNSINLEWNKSCLIWMICHQCQLRGFYFSNICGFFIFIIGILYDLFYMINFARIQKLFWCLILRKIIRPVQKKITNNLKSSEKTCIWYSQLLIFFRNVYIFEVMFGLIGRQSVENWTGILEVSQYFPLRTCPVYWFSKGK